MTSRYEAWQERRLETCSKFSIVRNLRKIAPFVVQRAPLLETLPALVNLAVKDELLQAIYTVSEFAQYL
jgi:hypothetical protein